jgi:uncharacterized UPF0146 family protein
VIILELAAAIKVHMILSSLEGEQIQHAEMGARLALAKLD